MTTGFTLGTSNGATLGTSDGGTLGNTPENWKLDGQTLPTTNQETATPTILTLGVRVTTERLLAALRTAKTDEDQIDVLPTDNGGYTAVDRANGQNTFTLTPPSRREPLRQEGTYHVARYEESLVSQDVGEWQVEIEFVRDTDRTDEARILVEEQPNATVGGADGFTLGTTDGATLGTSDGGTLGNTRAGVPTDFWGLTTRYGKLVTDRVDAEFLGTGADGVERFELVTRLTHRQAYTLETALSRPNGVRVRSIPDETNRAVDDTDDSALTITVDSPTEDVVTSGDYVLIEPWEATRLNDAYMEYSMVIAVEG